MNYGDITTAVLGNRFPQSSLGSAQQWINARYAWIWTTEDWTFKRGTDDVTTTANSAFLATDFPTDYEGCYGLCFGDDGFELLPMRSGDFHSEFYSTSPGRPYAYVSRAGTIYLGPTPDAVYPLTLDYRKAFVPLVNSADIPAIPAAFHYTLVTGAVALGLKMLNDPTWQATDQEFTNGIDVMRQVYLEDDLSTGNTWPSDPSF